MTQIKLTRDEKVKKYNRLTKRELIEMLIECENVVSRMPSTTYIRQPTAAPDVKYEWKITCS